MRAVVLWYREIATGTAHAHIVLGEVLGPTRVSLCGRVRTLRAHVSEIGIARCATCLAGEARIAREQVAA